MKVIETALPGVLIVEPTVFEDKRGFFSESYNKRRYEEAGIRAEFVQDNHARSGRNVLRGLHYQLPQPQGKLVRVVVGEVFDVAVDIRKGSPNFGRWTGETLTAQNKRVLWIPEGFAHGYLVLSDVAEITYKVSAYYAPQYERGIRWDDPDIGIQWPLQGQPILSEKDRSADTFRNAEVFS